jgi:Na+/proline symporter
MTIVLAIFAVRAVGGIDAMRAQIPAARLAFVPEVGSAWMPAITFAVYVGMQWWAAWYPGAEPGGGGYVAQRIFSAKTERDGVLATLWFNMAHYAVRSWPWILTALAATILYPHLDDPESGYVRVMIDHLPASLRGLMMAGFLAAYMSTIATHLNWGASYLVGDLYKRFVKPDADEQHYVRISRLATLITMILGGVLTLYMKSIAGAWQVLLALGSGTGLVLILRWYWWRINAWSEIVAMVASLVISLVLLYIVRLDPEDPRQYAYLMLGTLIGTTVAWLVATFVTKPEPEAKLRAFYLRVRPAREGWGPVAAMLTPDEARSVGPALAVRLRDWLLGCALVYTTLFGVGKLVLHERVLGIALLAGAALSAALLARDLRNENALSGSATSDRESTASPSA